MLMPEASPGVAAEGMYLQGVVADHAAQLLGDLGSAVLAGSRHLHLHHCGRVRGGRRLQQPRGCHRLLKCYNFSIPQHRLWQIDWRGLHILILVHQSLPGLSCSRSLPA